MRVPEEDLAERLDQLDALEQLLLARLHGVRGERAGVRAKMGELVQLERPARKVVPEEQWRRAVRELEAFTVTELAAKLKCSAQTAGSHLRAMLEMDPPMIRRAGSLGRLAMYEYLRPTSAGEAFEADVRHGRREVEAPSSREYAGPVTGTGGSPADAISATEVRRVVKDALARGWRLEKKGDGHWTLVKGLARVGVAGTPRAPENAARLIARRVQRYEEVTAA